jgi:acylphosphatase
LAQQSETKVKYMTIEDRRTVHLRITGKVQGVWYRGWTVEQARLRRLDGWVRNRADGSVEALLAGAAPDVDAMLDACWQGPPAAKVINVQVTEAEDPGHMGFEQRNDA